MSILNEQPSWRETIPAIASPDGYIASESENVRDAQILGLTDRTRYLYQTLNNMISSGSISDDETEEDKSGIDLVSGSNIKITKLDDGKIQISTFGLVRTINGNTGDVDIVPASIGAAAYEHDHDERYALKNDVSLPPRFIAGPGIVLDKESTPGAIIISAKGVSNDPQQNLYNGVPNINYNIGYPAMPEHHHEHHNHKHDQPKIKIKAGSGIDVIYDEETNTYTIINTELNKFTVTEDDYINMINDIDALKSKIEELEELLTRRPDKYEKPDRPHNPPFPPMHQPPHQHLPIPPMGDPEDHPIPPTPPLPPMDHHKPGEPIERWVLNFTLGSDAQISLGDIADYSGYLTPISNSDFWGKDFMKIGKYDRNPRVKVYRDSGTAANPSGEWIRVPRADADNGFIDEDPVFGYVSFNEYSKLITFTKGGSTNYLFKIVCKY